MSIVVTAEFESFDMADIAASKIRHLPGVEDIKATHGHNIKSNDNSEGDFAGDNFPTPIPPLGGGYSQASIFAPVAAIPAFSYENGNNTEVGDRKEIYVTAKVQNTSVAHTVSSAFLSTGGTKVRIINNPE